MAATVSSSLLVKTSPSSLASSKAGISGAAVRVVAQQPTLVFSRNVTCRAEKADETAAVSRRAALTLVAGAAALTLQSSPAEAVYGEAANVFGAPKKQTGFTPYAGSGFKLEVPSKWNPSKEIEFPGTVLRYEDNFDSTTNLAVVVTPAKKASITDYGSPEDFLETVSFLLGKQSYNGTTSSEGGFDKNAVVTASLLTSEKKTVDGKDYYKLSVLTRTADGDEGGKHQLITAAVSDGKLYVIKAQAGDKRWFKGARKFVEGAADSFVVA